MAHRPTRQHGTQTRVILYSRVSTEEQNPHTQLTGLRKHATNRGYHIVAEYEETMSTRRHRPKLQEALTILNDNKADAIIIRELSRLARSVQELITISGVLQEIGADLICTNQPIDTSTATGKLYFHILAAFSEFERDLISERTQSAYKTGKYPNWGKRGPDKHPRKRRSRQ